MAGGRKAKPAPPARPANTLVLDNGAYSLKAGLVRDGAIDEPIVQPNCITRDRSRKTYVGAEIESCQDFGEMQFRRPVEKGFIVNWEVQKEIWDRLFVDDGSPLQCDPSETRLILGEHANGLPILQANCDQIVFEEYGFTSYYRGLEASFNAYQDVQGLFRTPKDAATVANTPAEILLVVDSGFSSTTVTPMLRGQPLQSAIRRLDIGGRFLTNYLARLISLRHFDMRNDPYIVNEMKEAACYVTSDFSGDLDRSWRGTRGGRNLEFTSTTGIARDYILPDFHNRAKGSLINFDPARHTTARKIADAAHSQEDILTLRNERFVVPELIFNPSDAGLRMAGLGEVVKQSIEALPVGLWPGLLANIVVVGGNSLLDGFVHRLQKEVLQRVPDDCVVRVARPVDPIMNTWYGGANLANHANIDKLAVTKLEYEEHGGAWVARKFAAGLSFD